MSRRNKNINKVMTDGLKAFQKENTELKKTIQDQQAEIEKLKGELIDFKNWWNNLPDESDDRLFITKGTIERFSKAKNQFKKEKES